MNPMLPPFSQHSGPTNQLQSPNVSWINSMNPYDPSYVSNNDNVIFRDPDNLENNNSNDVNNNPFPINNNNNRIRSSHGSSSSSSQSQSSSSILLQQRAPIHQMQILQQWQQHQQLLQQHQSQLQQLQQWQQQLQQLQISGHSQSHQRHQHHPTRHHSSRHQSSRHQHSHRHHHHIHHIISNNNNKKSNAKDINNNINILDYNKQRICNRDTSLINWNEWQCRMESVDIDYKSINNLICDYFLCEADYDLTLCFSRESGTRINPNNNNIIKCKSRNQIKQFILSGNMLKAIELLKETQTDFIQKYPDIITELQKQHLCELIRYNQIKHAFKYNKTHLLPKTKLKNKNQNQNKLKLKKNQKLLNEIGDIMSLIVCVNINICSDNIPRKLLQLLSLERREDLSSKINRILLRNRIGGESLLYSCLSQINYYQNFLQNLGIKYSSDNGNINSKSKIMSYNEMNINRVQKCHSLFGKNNKHRSGLIKNNISGIQNWVKLDKKHKLNIKNYLPFMLDTSKCQTFKLKKLKKYNVIHVDNKKK